MIVRVKAKLGRKAFLFKVWSPMPGVLVSEQQFNAPEYVLPEGTWMHIGDTAWVQDADGRQLVVKMRKRRREE